MGLKNGYGVLIGTKHKYYRDPADDFGRYYHGNLEVSAAGIVYKCAIDVDPKDMPDGIEWRKVKIAKSAMAAFAAKADGWHPLASNATSGALDYIRSKLFNPSVRVPVIDYSSGYLKIVKWLNTWFRLPLPWNKGTGFQALTDLEAILTDVKRCYVFGEPFATGKGVHNIHQNQGDPTDAGTGFYKTNAIWQDGCTIIETNGGTFWAFMNKFKTQAYQTDDAGHPA